MSFKYFIPKVKSAPWRDYWSNKDMESDFSSCKKDELWGIIKKFVSLDDKIIDAGCGLGRWVAFLSRKNYKVLGIDNFKQLIERAKRFDRTLELRVADVLKLPFKNEAFDVYLSFGVVEHFEAGPTEALQEARRVLKKGGIIVLETPHDNFLRRTKHFFGFLKRKKKRTSELQFYEYRFKVSELKKFLKNLNFKILAIYPKDLLLDNESIGLWSDFPFLRAKSSDPFKLNIIGILIKKILKPFKFLFSGCVVVIGRKI